MLNKLLNHYTNIEEINKMKEGDLVLINNVNIEFLMMKKPKEHHYFPKKH